MLIGVVKHRIHQKVAQIQGGHQQHKNYKSVLSGSLKSLKELSKSEIGDQTGPLQRGPGKVRKTHVRTIDCSLSHIGTLTSSRVSRVF